MSSFGLSFFASITHCCYVSDVHQMQTYEHRDVLHPTRTEAVTVKTRAQNEVHSVPSHNHQCERNDGSGASISLSLTSGAASEVIA